MQKNETAVEVADNGGRRRVKNRRFLVSIPCSLERRTNWDRRSGYDPRLKRISDGFVKKPEIKAWE
jgi:hypothetical protein